MLVLDTIYIWKTENVMLAATNLPPNDCSLSI